MLDSFVWQESKNSYFIVLSINLAMPKVPRKKRRQCDNPVIVETVRGERPVRRSERLMRAVGPVSPSAESARTVTEPAFTSRPSTSEGLSNGLPVDPPQPSTSGGPVDPERDIHKQRIFLQTLDKGFIDKMFSKYKGAIFNIFRNREASSRNNQYNQGDAQCRSGLMCMVEVSEVTDEIIYHIMRLMVDTFSPDLLYHNYLWKVSLPEFVIRIFMDKFSISYAESVKRLEEIFELRVVEDRLANKCV